MTSKSQHTIHFKKMHGIGNDFIVIDAINQIIDEEQMHKNAVKWCDRHFGIGADGVIVATRSESAALKMRIFNADGSEPQMCGNGIRCLAVFAKEENLVTDSTFSIETLAGQIVPTVTHTNAGFEVKVDMGPPILQNNLIPIAGIGSERSINRTIQVNSTDYTGTAVSMGNPHFVIFGDDPYQLDLNIIGPKFENAPEFPERTNTEFVKIISPSHAIMRVWERGSGETLACGTGACAVLVAGVLTGKLDTHATIELPGGRLKIEWKNTDAHVIMTGAAQTVYNGTITI